MSIGSSEDLELTDEERTYFDSTPVVAWRVWRATDNGLTSVNQTIEGVTVVWPARQPLIAVCLCKPMAHEIVPTADPSCGIYAVKEHEFTKRWSSGAHHMWAPKIKSPFVIGQVSLWGRVFRHEQGYRAQYAYPLNLSVKLSISVDADWVDALAERYGVPLLEEAA